MVYVACASCRFCTEKYSLSSKNLKNRFGHLTNYSVNKKNEAFGKNTDAGADGEGSKWSLQALLKWFAEHGISGDRVRAAPPPPPLRGCVPHQRTTARSCDVGPARAGHDVHF